VARPLCFFVRHGETDWNAEGRLQGQADRNLTEKGRGQATGNGIKLKSLVGDASGFDFVSSPMLRTRHTMERLRDAMGLDPQAYRTDPRFTFAELEEKTPGLRQARNRDKWNYLPPGKGAESYALLAKRLDGWLREVDKQTICVAHGGIVRSLFYLLGEADEEAASTMDIPQDRILRMENDRLTWI
jgi:broad specificity phosphatase PhoE